MNAARAYAYLGGADRVEPEHLEVLASVLWDDSEEQPAVCSRVIARVVRFAALRDDPSADRPNDPMGQDVAAVRAVLPPVQKPVADSPVPTPLPEPQPPKPTLKARILTGLTRVKAWAGRQLDAVMGVAVVGWAMLRLLALAVAHSPVAVASAVVSGLTFGVLAAVTDPAVAVALTALSVGTLTASAVSAAPLLRAAVELDLDLDRAPA